jgi:uncharacterized protein
MTEPEAAADTKNELVQGGLVGALAGFLSGLFGVGGGIMIVPGLVLLTGMDQRLAHGTSLTAIIPIAISGIGGYLLDDLIDFPVALFVTIGAVGGAILGTHFLQILPQRTLRLAFAVLLLLSAARLLLGDVDADGRVELTVLSAIALVVLGVASGGLAGLLGVGGGVIMVPVFILLFAIPSAIAKGTSLLVILPTSLVGTYRNLKKGNTKIRMAVAVGLAGVVTAFIGSRISANLDADVSNFLFGVLLVVVALRMGISELRTKGDDH